jgi:hypothetical protein
MRLYETLNVLFDYLKASGRTMHLRTTYYYLKNINIKDYTYAEELSDNIVFSNKCNNKKGKYLGLVIKQGHSVWVDLSDVNAILFDAIVNSPTNAKEMWDCIKALEKEKPYNVYLVNKKDGKSETWILDIFMVSKGNCD